MDKSLYLSDSFIMKSPLFSDARTPEEVITARVLTLAHRQARLPL
ncbi:MAG: hypothetical protein ACLR56_11385 [Oscillospiraceae bacterium]